MASSVDAPPEVQALRYLNEAARRSYICGTDTAYLRERLAEGRELGECEQAIEAAIASGRVEIHPRNIFSGRNFDDLLKIRLNRRTWNDQHYPVLESTILKRFPEPTEAP